MRKAILTTVCLLAWLATSAQQPHGAADTTTFKGRFVNAQHNIYIELDAYRKNVRVPGQDLYGELPGYLGDGQDSRKWLFTDSRVVRPDELALAIINDYGSEDLEASFTRQNDSTFVLKQGKGSTLKIARDRKWQKLPKVLVFIKK